MTGWLVDRQKNYKLAMASLVDKILHLSLHALDKGTTSLAIAVPMHFSQLLV